jgi:asparagine synthase (glutamine-hydrolysing)
VPPAFWSSAARILGRDVAPNFGSKVQKGLRVAAHAHHFEDVYESFLDEWSQEPSPVRGSRGVDPYALAAVPASESVQMMACDAVTYLPDDILCKVDRAAMAVSLETRVPFLDHRVAALAARIPVTMKLEGGVGKTILRELLYREAPRQLFDRPKAGFAVPVGEWIKGPLRPWAEELLDPRAMASEGYLDPAIVHKRWRQHLAGQRDSTPALWAVLMFQAWQRRVQSD